VEPISYFLIVGFAGTYMAFVSCNINNLRIPCAMITQKAAGVESGTDKGSIVATLGMAVSIILAAGSFAGGQVLQQQPEFVVKALQLLLPALFSAIFVQFATSKFKLAPIILALCLFLAIGVRKGFIPGFASTLIAVFVIIAIAIFFYKKNIIK